MKILCTGGAGFIGSFLVDELIRMGHEVRIYDNIEPQVHPGGEIPDRSEEHTSELQSHSFISYAVFCLKKKKKT